MIHAMAIKRISDKRRAKQTMNRKIKFFMPANRRSYETQIINLNKKLDKFRSENEELMMQAKTLTETNRTLHEDSIKSDPENYLKQVAEGSVQKMEFYFQKQNEMKEENETEINQYEQLLEEARNRYRLMHDHFTTEIQLLRGQLNSLEKFRELRDGLTVKYDGCETEDDSECREAFYKHVIFDLERQLIQDKDDMKREMERRLMQLADDFHDAANTCMHSVMHRTIKENIAVHDELDAALQKCRTLENKIVEFKESSKKSINELKLYEEDKCQLLQKTALQKTIIDNLTKKYEMALRDIAKQKEIEITRIETHQELKKSLLREQHLTSKLKCMEQKLHSKQCENMSVKECLNQEQCENVKFINTIRRASSINKKLMKLQGQVYENVSYDLVHSKRQELLDYMNHLFIYSCESSNQRTPSLESLTQQDDMYKNAEPDYESNLPIDQTKEECDFNTTVYSDAIDITTESKSNTDGKTIVFAEEETVLKSEDEIIEEIVEQEEPELRVICSQDFSKPIHISESIPESSDIQDNYLIYKETDAIPTSTTNTFDCEIEEDSLNEDIDFRKEPSIISTRKSMGTQKLQLFQYPKDEFQTKISFIDKDYRNKRITVNDETEKKLISGKKTRKSLLPPLVDKKSGTSLSTERQSRTFLNSRKSSRSEEFTQSTSTWSNAAADAGSFKSRSAGFKRHASLTNNLPSSWPPPASAQPASVHGIANYRFDNADDREHNVRYDKKLLAIKSKSETPSDVCVLSRKQRTYDTNFVMMDAPSDTCYY